MSLVGRARRGIAAIRHKGTTSTERLRLLRRLGAFYYVTTGVWPLVNMASFEFITGPKHDRWLVNTVGVLVAAIGAGQLRAADRPSREMRQLSAGVALGLAAIELRYWRRGTISLVYALDALGQLALAVAWLVSESGLPHGDARSSRAVPAGRSAGPRRGPGRARC